MTFSDSEGQLCVISTVWYLPKNARLNWQALGVPKCVMLLVCTSECINQAKWLFSVRLKRSIQQQNIP